MSRKPTASIAGGGVVIGTVAGIGVGGAASSLAGGDISTATATCGVIGAMAASAAATGTCTGVGATTRALTFNVYNLCSAGP